MKHLFVPRYEEIPDEWEPPAPQPYTDMGNLHYYLLEPDAYDQFSTVMNRGGTVQIWLNSVPEPIKLVEKEVMSCLFLHFKKLFSVF